MTTFIVDIDNTLRVIENDANRRPFHLWNSGLIEALAKRAKLGDKVVLFTATSINQKLKSISDGRTLEFCCSFFMFRSVVKAYLKKEWGLDVAVVTYDSLAETELGKAHSETITPFEEKIMVRAENCEGPNAKVDLGDISLRQDGEQTLADLGSSLDKLYQESDTRLAHLRRFLPPDCYDNYEVQFNAELKRRHNNEEKMRFFHKLYMLTHILSLISNKNTEGGACVIDTDICVIEDSEEVYKTLNLLRDEGKFGFGEVKTEFLLIMHPGKPYSLPKVPIISFNAAGAVYSDKLDKLVPSHTQEKQPNASESLITSPITLTGKAAIDTIVREVVGEWIQGETTALVEGATLPSSLSASQTLQS